MFHYTSDSQSVVLGPEVAVMSLENLFEVRIFGPYSMATESQTGGGVQQFVC